MDHGFEDAVCVVVYEVECLLCSFQGEAVSHHEPRIDPSIRNHVERGLDAMVLAANVFISTTEPGRMDVVKHESVGSDWEAFKLVAALWRYAKGYDPRGSEAES